MKKILLKLLHASQQNRDYLYLKVKKNGEGMEGVIILYQKRKLLSVYKVLICYRMLEKR